MCAGKTTVAKFLVEELGFFYVESAAALLYGTSTEALSDSSSSCTSNTEHSINHTSTSGFPTPTATVLAQSWRSHLNVVVDNVRVTDSNLPDLLRRPYFLLVHVDAPLSERFIRSRLSMIRRESQRVDNDTDNDDDDDGDDDDENQERDDKKGNKTRTLKSLHNMQLLAKFIQHDETQQYPYRDSTNSIKDNVPFKSLDELEQAAHVRVFNDHANVEDFVQSLRASDFIAKGQQWLRPGWDAYFMQLALHAARRTNCMKRGVGAVVARDRRVVSSGYNGTPSGVTNCSDGGCPRCNGVESANYKALDLCLCLHAEENAIIEAGRERCTKATLYTTLFPCVLCAKKIIQAGVSRVVFNKYYSSKEGDSVSRMLMEQSHIIIDQVSM